MMTLEAAKETLTLLARIAQRCEGRQGLTSLPPQFANALGQLAGFLSVRGESHLEHYYAEALTLACIRPATADIRGYEALLFAFAKFDRRHPALPSAEAILPLRLDDQHAIHFIQLLRSHSAFQPLYHAAQQFDAYGAMGRTKRKCERIILFSREISGQALLRAPTAEEELYLRLAATT